MKGNVKLAIHIEYIPRKIRYSQRIRVKKRRPVKTRNHMDVTDLSRTLERINGRRVDITCRIAEEVPMNSQNFLSRIQT
ncbi:MAG: hypothetical protein SOT60_03535 [Bilifractor sp.]|jgi:hypothetical protein|nr:hypothetical protein [Lachnospiraceae bacterium]MDY2836998.1 hypothetical protein [Bilifractor sp.]